jgi:iron complex outermembrane receptor protein
MVTTRRSVLFCLALLLSRAVPLPAQEADAALTAEEADGTEEADEAEAEEVIILPPAEVVEQADSPNVVTHEEMEREGARDLWQAVRNVPGVILSGGGPRNDSSLSVRGFDSASMPVFVDGVTQANPYRGDNDAARMLTADMESVTIEKGFSTLLLGPNTMGGAILIRTSRPKEPLEASASSAFGFDILGKPASAYHTAALGARGELFYGKTVFQYRGIDHFRIPDEFEPRLNNPQKRGDRLWSDSNDIKLTLLAGWTPFYNMDLSLTWIYQDSNKGFSPPSVNGRDFELWEWPYYRRQGLTFSGEWTPDAFTLKTSAYFQKFDNRLLDYVNWPSYEAEIPAPPSDYDDFTAGFHLEAGWEPDSRQKVEAAINFRQDDHRGLSGGDLGVHVTEDTWSFAASYTARPLPSLSGFRVIAAAGFDLLVPALFWGEFNELMVDDPSKYVEKSSMWKLWAGEAGLFYDVDIHAFRVTYARKNHFPTMFQRYSTRAGDLKPNPNLGPEWADHFEAAYRLVSGGLSLDAAVYYSLVTQKIVEIRVPKPDFTAVTVPYSVNLDSAAVWGIEAGLGWTLSPSVSAGATFSWNRYTVIKSSRDITELALYPEITAGAHAELSPIPGITLIPSLRYVDSRWADSSAETRLDAYCLVNLKAVYEVNRRLSVSASVENLFDTLYEIRAFFPQPGRTYELQVSLRW